MLPDISNAFILFGGGLSFLIALVQLIQAKRRFSSLLLFVIFLSFSIIQLQGYVISSSHYVKSAATMVFMVAEFLLGPTIYIFYMSVFKKDYEFSKKDFIYFAFIPAVLIVIIIVMLPYQYRSGAFAIPYRFIEKYNVVEYLHSFGFAMILGYLLAIFSKFEVMKIVRDYNRNRLLFATITVIATLSVIITLIIISLITGNGSIVRWAMILTSIFIIFWFALSQVHPEVFLAIAARNRKTGRIEGILQGIDTEKLRSDLDEILSKEKLYYDEDLSLKRLADLLEIQPQELSAYLNHHLQINFNSFINRYRVDEAIQLMREDSSRSIITIAFSVGFNSKSVFYDAFTRQTGLSPAKFRKKFISSDKSPE